MKTPTTPEPDQRPEASDKPIISATTPENAQGAALYALIEQQPFFKGLNARHLQLLTDSAMEMHFETGQNIFQEGGPANRFYVILTGKVALETELRDRGMIPIKTIGAGDDLGWSWLFPPYSLVFSARALEPTRTIFFYGTRLREQCEQDHEFGYQIIQRIAGVAIQHLRATQQRLIECQLNLK